MKRSFLAPVVVALLALASGGWFLQRGASQERNVYFSARLFEEVFKHISDRYVDEKDRSELYRMAIDGLLEKLGDPHTVFMTPEDYDRLRVQTQGEYGGLGIEIDVRNGWLTVVSPLPGTPAERAGLRAGDRIVEVDGESTRGWTTDDGVANLRGPRGRPVDLRIARYGVDEPIEVRVVREEIQITAVPTAYLTEDAIGYIRLDVFNEHATDEVRRTIDRLREEGMRGLVLDLRQNPGGLLDQGIALSDLFLSRGQIVAETRSRISSQNHQARARSGERYPGLPIVVLVSPQSASASEILAGALQDHDRAVVIGRTTFGKGSVQTLFPLAGGNYLKLTTARWYTPLGRSIHRPADRPHPAALEDELGRLDEADVVEPAEEFRTPSGRIVLGGGGIRPDLVIRPDELTEAEQELNRVMLRKFPQLQDAEHRFAYVYTHENPNLERDFVVTPAMLDRFYTMLRESGFEVDREVYDQVGHVFAQRLGFRISYAAWGRQEAQRRDNMEDEQVNLARQLLREATDPASLIAAVEAHKARVEAAASEDEVRASAQVPQP